MKRGLGRVWRVGKWCSTIAGVVSAVLWFVSVNVVGGSHELFTTGFVQAHLTRGGLDFAAMRRSDEGWCSREAGTALLWRGYGVRWPEWTTFTRQAPYRDRIMPQGVQVLVSRADPCPEVRPQVVHMLASRADPSEERAEWNRWCAYLRNPPSQTHYEIFLPFWLPFAVCVMPAWVFFGGSTDHLRPVSVPSAGMT